MNGRDDGPLHELVPEEWRALDDTLDDPLGDSLEGGEVPAAVPAAAAPWLARQRFVHGLLRALHTQDAAAREGRVARLLERIDREGQVAGRRRYAAAVVLAAAALVAGLLWLTLPERLPTAEAAVSRMVAEMARDVDRRFRVEVRSTGLAGREAGNHEFLLVTRPGMRFRVDGRLAFGGAELGELRLGCDGEELWMHSTQGWLRHAVPLAERERLLDRLGGVLDVGYLDVHDLVRRLPEDLELRVVDRLAGDDGRSLLRVEAERRAGAPAQGKAKLNAAWLLYEEATGMVRRIELDAVASFGFTYRFVLDYLGEEPAGLVGYGRPW